MMVLACLKNCLSHKLNREKRKLSNLQRLHQILSNITSVDFLDITLN